MQMTTPGPQSPAHAQSVAVCLPIVAAGVVLYGLVMGRDFLVPLAIAVLLWNLLEALIDGLQTLSLGPLRLSRGVSAALALAVIALAVYSIGVVVSGQADAINEAWPRYEMRLRTRIADVSTWAGPDISAKAMEVVSRLQLSRVAAGLLASVQSFAFTATLVLLYVIFMMVERGHSVAKLTRLAGTPERSEQLQHVLGDISASIRRYLWLKTAISLLTGALSYAVLRAFEIDFAETWALLIFLLNYIPNVGSAIGVAFPALLALLQFDGWTTFLAVGVLLLLLQVAIGNFLEPAMMGSSLNLSALAIMLSLTFWGTIWGLPGMFLCVPIMVVMAIACANIPKLGWIAVLLSSDGRIAPLPAGHA